MDQNTDPTTNSDQELIFDEYKMTEQNVPQKNLSVFEVTIMSVLLTPFIIVLIALSFIFSGLFCALFFVIANATPMIDSTFDQVISHFMDVSCDSMFFPIIVLTLHILWNYREKGTQSIKKSLIILLFTPIFMLLSYLLTVMTLSIIRMSNIVDINTFDHYTDVLQTVIINRSDYYLVALNIVIYKLLN